MFYFLSHFHYFISVIGYTCVYQKGDQLKLNEQIGERETVEGKEGEGQGGEGEIKEEEGEKKEEEKKE